MWVLVLTVVVGSLIWMRREVRQPDSSGTRLPLFTATELSPLPDGPSRLLNRAEVVSTPLRRTLRRHFFRSETKPVHGAMRVAAVFWLARNDVRRPWYVRWLCCKESTTDDVAAALQHLLGTTPPSETHEAEAAVDRAIDELSRLIAQTPPESERLRELRQTLTSVLDAHRLRVPPVVPYLNRVAPRLGDFFLRESIARHGITMRNDAIMVTAGLPGQVVHLIENVVSESDRSEVYRLFQRTRLGRTLGFDQTLLKNRRSNRERSSKYEGDLLRAYESFLIAPESSA